MHWLALGTALLVALAIIAIDTQYVASPLAATRSFGLPIPENDTNIAWWCETSYRGWLYWRS
jgi:hypothetical protein